MSVLFQSIDLLESWNTTLQVGGVFFAALSLWLGILIGRFDKKRKAQVTKKRLEGWSLGVQIAVILFTVLILFLTLKVSSLNAASEAEKDKLLTEARTEAADARADSARANARADDLDQKMAPRRLTIEQQDAFIALVAQAPKGEIVVYYLTGDTEAQRFSQSIARMFRVAGYGVTHRGAMQTDDARAGIQMWTPNNISSIADPIRESLVEIGVTAVPRRIPRQKEELVAFVSSKPR